MAHAGSLMGFCFSEMGLTGYCFTAKECDKHYICREIQQKSTAIGPSADLLPIRLLIISVSH